MTKAKLALVLAVYTLALCALLPFGSAASALPDNTVVTKSYIDEVFIPKLANYAVTNYRAWFQQNPTDIERAIMQARQAAGTDGFDELVLTIADAVRGRQVHSAERGTVLSLSPGDTLVGGQGCMASVISGTIYTSGQTLDFTAAKDLAAGSAPAAGHMLCFLDGGGLKAVSSSKIEVFGYYRLVPGPRSKYPDIADALHAMGLFAGTNNGYELERSATRIEILVMLIKLLGENDAATSYPGTHPFKDVPAWAGPYVAYAYHKGYTAGTSATTFSPGAAATGDQYATFVLKALGYDSNSDFVWSSALSYAVSIGMLSGNEAALLGQPFLRDKMVYMSYYALFANYKGKDTTLLQGLVAGGKISQATADSAVSSVSRTRP